MKDKKTKPPILASWLLKRFAQYDDDRSLNGDFDEEYYEIIHEKGKITAWSWYWRHLIFSLPFIIHDSTFWSVAMFKNFLKVSFRNMRRQKGFTFINITGLAIGITVCTLIMLWVLDELSFDRYHENADRIFRVCFKVEGNNPFQSPATMAPAAPAMVEEFPEVINAVRILPRNSATVKYKDNISEERYVYFADNSIFDIFSFPLLKGDPKTALKSANSVVLTEDVAKKIFGDDDPMGKMLKINGEMDFNVTGIVQNVPQNSHFIFNMLCSFETFYAVERTGLNNWMDIQYYTYVLLSENSNPIDLEQKFPILLEKHVGERLRAMGATISLFLQPLKRIHLHSNFNRDMASIGNIMYVYLFSGIALFVLLIACVNFINLSTARSATRAREVGMRKTLGAIRNKLIGQFLCESMLYSLLSLFLAGLLLAFSLSWFNNLVGREVSMKIVQTFWLIPAMLLLALLVGFAAGSYPAFVLSAFHPIHVLKSGFMDRSSKYRFRNILVSFQFIISITLIICSLTIYRQIHFLKNKNLGFDKEHILVIPGMNNEMRNSYQSIQNEFKNIPGVIDVSASSLVPSRGNLVGAFLPEGFPENQQQRMDYIDIDHNYLTLMSMDIVAGRNFSKEFVTDQEESVIINETAARQFGWTEPIGKTFIFRPLSEGQGETSIMNVIGVVKDFHRASLHQKIEPLILFYDPSEFNNLSLKVSSDNISQTITQVEKKWQEIIPQRPFNFFFLDEYLDRLYSVEERIGKVSLYFSLLAIFIGCLGLFGLAAFMAEKRTKEIGVRKVLGASVLNIVRLQSKEFIILVIIANVIAWPLAYFGLSQWLQNFAYRAGFSWWICVLTGILAVLIAIMTVSYQSIKAALTNPVDALKYE